MKLLSLEHVSISYEKKSVVEDVSFSIEDGDFLCILGENGSGKSSLLKGILGLLPLSGNIQFSLKKEEMGYLPQFQIHTKFPASVFEVVRSGFSPSLKRRGDIKKKVLENMQHFHIEDLKDRNFQELSGGQMERVLLARTLAEHKKILFLDEPTTGLDIHSTKELYQMIHKLNQEQKITIVMVTHDVDRVLEYANKILYLQKKMLFFGTTDQYLSCDICENWVGCGHD